MRDEHRSRRSFLRASAGLASVAAVGSTAGCLDSVPLIGGGGELNAVPEDTSGLLYADIDTIRTDEGVTQVANAYYEAMGEYDYYDGPESWEEALDEFEDEIELDPREAHEIVGFAGYGGDYGLVDDEYTAVVVWAEWDADDVTDSIARNDDDLEFEEDEHEGQTVYEPSEDWTSWVGVLGDGQYVVGQEDAVEDAIDATKGEDDGLESEVRNAYSNTRSAPFRFASLVPDPGEYDTVPESYGRGDEAVDLGVLEDVATVGGSIYDDGDTYGMAATLAADDSETAENLADIIDGAIAVYQDRTYNETASDLVDELDVSQDGSSVTVTFEQTLADLTDLIEENVGPRN